MVSTITKPSWLAAITVSIGGAIACVLCATCSAAGHAGALPIGFLLGANVAVAAAPTPQRV